MCMVYIRLSSIRLRMWADAMGYGMRKQILSSFTLSVTRFGLHLLLIKVNTFHIDPFRFLLQQSVVNAIADNSHLMSTILPQNPNRNAIYTIQTYSEQ